MTFFEEMLLNLLVLKGFALDAIFLLAAVAVAVVEKEKSTAAGLACVLTFIVATFFLFRAVTEWLPNQGSETVLAIQLKNSIVRYQEAIGYEIFSVEGRRVHFVYMIGWRKKRV